LKKAVVELMTGPDVGPTTPEAAMSGRPRGVGVAVPIEREQRLWSPRRVEDCDRVGIGNEPIVEVLDEEKRRRFGQVVVAIVQTLGGAGHDDRCLDPSITAATVGHQAQGCDGTVGVARRPDLVRVDQTRQRPV
jgi:hypothetical protein